MRLTSYTDYAFRTLIFLAVNRESGGTVASIAEYYGISRNHLMKVVQRLAQHGFLESTRGRGGGIRLGREPESIRVGDVVRATEDDLRLVECFGEHEGCAIREACRLRGVFGAALESFMTTLDEHTLADIVRDDAALERLVGIRRSPTRSGLSPG